MPHYTVEEIVSATHLRKDGTEIISKNGKKMWRVTVHIKEFPGKYIVGFTPWEPDARFLGIWDLVISTKQWEDRTNYCFSLAALLKPDNRADESALVTPEARLGGSTMNAELARNISEVVDRLDQVVDEIRGILSVATETEKSLLSSENL